MARAKGQSGTRDIVSVFSAGGRPGDWDATLWRLGRTGIGTSPSPFSDMAGFERLQVVVQGRGLRLRGADGSEIDVRTPFVPVRFDGATKIDALLDDGPVEVVNLIVRRSHATGSLNVVGAGTEIRFGTGTHVVYAADGPIGLALENAIHTIPAGHALLVEGGGTLRIFSGRGLLAGIQPK
ncbi:MAG: HutD family protein [Proteobacteria bacterium]|nr:HutD family protein [Pseudomonadota bacterium]